MNRKQEVIEIIGTQLSLVYHNGMIDKVPECYDFKAASEALCDRIAPRLQGRFPEKEFRQAAQLYRQARDDWFMQHPGMRLPITRTFDQMIADFRSIWEGEEISGLPTSYGDGTKTPTSQLHVEKKGTCRTCGGSGEWAKVRINYRNKNLTPCPDCKGTREDRRSGEERRGLDRRHCNIPKYPLSGSRIAGRRSDDNQDGSNYRARVWQSNRRTIPDRRT